MCAAKYPSKEVDSCGVTESKGDNLTLFDSLFKLYKKRVPISTLPSPLNLQLMPVDSQWNSHIRITPIENRDRDNYHNKLGLTSPSHWRCYTIPDLYPGLMYVPNIFKQGCQYPWVWRAITEYNRLPNKCNIDAHTLRSDGSRLWNAADWLHKAYSREDLRLEMKSNAMYQLRWATVGYQYDWTHKVYREKDYSPIPKDLTLLFQYISRALGFGSFKLEAGIINYYHLDSSIAGHIDKAEFDQDAPLFSLSFGQPAVFLVGGATKRTEPVPLLLQSGDLVAMTGPTRMAYHAVPRIIPQEGYTDAVSVTEKERTLELIEPLVSEEMFDQVEAVRNYMECSRINMNMRQVGMFPKK